MNLFKMAAAAGLLFALGACASWPGLTDAQRLALYQEHAGEPVDSFHYFGSLTGWTPLDDSVLVVWARPKKAYLLDLFGPCSGLQYTPAIRITQQLGRVSSGFDEVIVLDDSAFNIPCRIETIRPIDVDAMDAAREAMNEKVEVVERNQGAEGSVENSASD